MAGIEATVADGAIADKKTEVYIQAQGMRLGNALGWALRAGRLAYEPTKSGGIRAVKQ